MTYSPYQSNARSQIKKKYQSINIKMPKFAICNLDVLSTVASSSRQRWTWFDKEQRKELKDKQESTVYYQTQLSQLANCILPCCLSLLPFEQEIEK